MLKVTAKSILLTATGGIEKVLKRRGSGMGQLRAMLRGAYPITLVRSQTIDGLTLALDPESFMDWITIDKGYYEREVLDEILRHLPAGGVLWDIGANIGQHALTTKHFRPDASVYAFEPVPFTAARLMMNARLNGLDIEICSFGLGDAPGYGKISVAIRGNAGLSSFSPWPGTLYEGAVVCRIERGDTLVAKKSARSPSVIKMDVEGFELAVLNGLDSTIKSETLRAIIFESDGAHLSRIKENLDINGFSISPLVPKNREESSHATPNYVAVRR